jgi:hypothetical protein
LEGRVFGKIGAKGGRGGVGGVGRGFEQAKEANGVSVVSEGTSGSKLSDGAEAGNELGVSDGKGRGGLGGRLGAGAAGRGAVGGEAGGIRSLMIARLSADIWAVGVD